MRVWWLRHERLPSAGRLCLTHTPGAAQGSRDDDLDDLARLGIDRIICLQQPGELALLRPPECLAEREQAVTDRGIAFVHEPIEDFGAPDHDQAERLVALLTARLEAGERIAMHCWAGLGRAGTIASCLLVARGIDPHQAVRAVRRARSGAVQSMEQMQFIEAFARARASRPDS